MRSALLSKLSAVGDVRQSTAIEARLWDRAHSACVSSNSSDGDPAETLALHDRPSLSVTKSKCRCHTYGRGPPATMQVRLSLCSCHSVAHDHLRQTWRSRPSLAGWSRSVQRPSAYRSKNCTHPQVNQHAARTSAASRDRGPVRPIDRHTTPMLCRAATTNFVDMQLSSVQ